MKQETITLINGNKQKYNLPLPKIVFLTKHINNVALAHIAENTGLFFTQKSWLNSYEAQPINSNQIISLFLTYNFKTRYYNNLTFENTLFLKSDHHIGFDVDCICFDCVKKNNISTGNLKPGDFLSC